MLSLKTLESPTKGPDLNDYQLCKMSPYYENTIVRFF